MMAFKYLQHIALITSLLHLTTAQQSNIVPQDLRTGFTSSSTDVQVSYTNQAVNGFRDGTVFEKNAVAQEPTFALGDSSGISPLTLYTLIMLDTTCPQSRVLHYARSNFKNNFDITNINTSSPALQAYQAPGSFGETGDNRQYSFLMYKNPQNKVIDSLVLPKEGEKFDVQKFQDDNRLPDAVAGVGMVVKLGGTADCGGDQANGLPSSLPSAIPASSSAAKVSSANGGASSTAAVVSRASSAVNGGPTPSSLPGISNGTSSVSSGARTSGAVAASSVLQSDAPEPSTITSTVVLNSGGPAGTPTSSGSAVQQSTNAAPSSHVVGSMAMAQLVAIIGVLLW